jgi:hypothetical protein
MSERGELRTYLYGDEITMRMTFTHDATLTAIEVIYTHREDGSHMITLSGNPELVEGGEVAGQGKRSVVVLTGTVDESLIVGRYLPRRVVAYTFAGRTDLKEPTSIGPWPDLYVNYGSANIREATIETEPER